MFFTVEETNLMCCFDTPVARAGFGDEGAAHGELDDEMA